LDALDLPVLELSPFDAKRIRDGKLHSSSHTGLLVAICEGELVAVLEGDGQNLKVRRAWAAEDQGKGER
jgi:tRNA pseudouridine55 synthase